MVVATIYAFQTFGQIDILIGYQNAGRSCTSNVLIYNIYNDALTQQTTPGVAAVMSIALFPSPWC